MKLPKRNYYFQHIDIGNLEVKQVCECLALLGILNLAYRIPTWKQQGIYQTFWAFNMKIKTEWRESWEIFGQV